jgi:hypothetical protein
MSGGPPPLPLIPYPSWLQARAGDAAMAASKPTPEEATKGFLQHLWDFFAGDIGSFWNGGADGFPYGKWIAGAIRVFRGTGFIINTLRGLEPAVPLFTNGFVGKLLISGLQKVAPNAAGWLGGAAGSLFFQRLGIVGGLVGGGIGTYKLIQEGNPIDAYERRGAGYVADVASTAFSFSSAAFFAFPNPYTGGAMVITGAVWLGAEVWDAHGEDIKDAVSSAVDTVGDVASSAVAGLGDALDTATSFISSEFDDFTGSVAGAIGSIF